MITAPPRSFDLVVIGAGVVGCAIARELTTFDASLAVIERHPDVCEGTSKANSAIVHTGFDAPPGSLEARLLREARDIWPHVVADLHVPYLQTGAIMVATDEHEQASLRDDIMPKADRNGVAVQSLAHEEIAELVPTVTDRARAALLIEGEGVVDPFWAARSYCESAVVNGAEVFLGQSVTSIVLGERQVTLQTSADVTITAKAVVNAAGLWADDVSRLAGDDSFRITPRRGEFLITEDDLGVGQIILPVPTKTSKGILLTPIVFGGTLLGPTAEEVVDKRDVSTTARGLQEVRAGAAKLVPIATAASSVRQFAGLRAVSSTGEYIIGPSRLSPRLIHVAGIRSTGLSASPAIARHVASLVSLTLGLSRRNTHRPELPEILGDLAADAGEVVCLCRTITRAEIAAAMLSALPPRSLDGVKRRTGAMLGDCQGNLCAPRIARLFAECLGRDPVSLDKNIAGSRVFLGRGDTREAAISEDDRASTAKGDGGRSESPSPSVRQPYDLAVVGAGTAALSFLRELARIGVNDSILVVEFQDAPGGFLRHALPAVEFPAASELVRTATLPGRAELRCEATAVGLIPAAGEDEPHVLLVRDAGGTRQVPVKRAVIASGGLEIPREHADLPGSRPAGVVTPSFVHHALAFGWLPGRRAVVYGASLAAALVARRLAAAGVEAMLVPPAGERPPACDPAVRVLPPAELVAIRGAPRLEWIELRRNGAVVALPADTLVYAVGMRPNTHWLKGSGIVLNDRGAVAIDERFQVSAPGVLAIGTVTGASSDHAASIEMGIAAARTFGGGRS